MAGLGVALPLLTLGFSASLWSLGLLVEVAERLQCRRLLFLCRTTGGPILGVVYQACVFCQHFGAILGYQIISTEVALI
jgi:hypothetical protein